VEKPGPLGKVEPVLNDLASATQVPVSIPAAVTVTALGSKKPGVTRTDPEPAAPDASAIRNEAMSHAKPAGEEPAPGIAGTS
jgi:hypothetical protein